MDEEIKNSYKLETHRLAFDQAVELLKSGLNRLEVSRQLDHEIPREMRQKITAKAARQLCGEKRSRGGTPPNTSIVLAPTELEFIHRKYGGEKSRAIHDGLKMLMSKAP